MAYSTIPAAKTQILTTLRATVGLAGTLVSRGLPPAGKVPSETERIYVDNAVEITREWAGIGQFKLDESYTIRIPVEVFQYDANGDPENQAICEDRMWELVAIVERAILADLQLNQILAGPGHAKPAGCEDQNVFAGDKGWISHTVLRIDCKARI